jgi:hypothetical protein
MNDRTDNSKPSRRFTPLALLFWLAGGTLFPCLPPLVSGGIACFVCFGFPSLLAGLIISILAIRNKEPLAGLILALCILSILIGCSGVLFRMTVPYRPPFPPL